MEITDKNFIKIRRAVSIFLLALIPFLFLINIDDQLVIMYILAVYTAVLFLGYLLFVTKSYKYIKTKSTDINLLNLRTIACKMSLVWSLITEIAVLVSGSILYPGYCSNIINSEYLDYYNSNVIFPIHSCSLINYIFGQDFNLILFISLAIVLLFIVIMYITGTILQNRLNK